MQSEAGERALRPGSYLTAADTTICSPNKPVYENRFASRHESKLLARTGKLML